MSYKCKECNSVKVKTRTNYPHGKKSKAISSQSCAICGSTNIEEVRQFFKKKR